MQIQRINFTQHYAQIATRGIEHAGMQITTPGGQMTIDEQRPELQIETQMPTFRVPRERLRRELNLSSPLDFAKDFRNKGRQVALQAAANYKNDGNFLANPRIPGDKAVPMLSGNKMKRALKAPEKNIGLMPSSPPSLDWTKGYINVNASKHNVAVDWSGSNMANITVDTSFPAEVTLSRRHSFTVTGVQPSVTNSTIGNYVNRMV